MLGEAKITVSPTRTYVALCTKGNFNGHYFRKFTLPKTLAEVPTYATGLYAVHKIIVDSPSTEIAERDQNNCEMASWYFLNVLNHLACIEGCITFEDYSNLEDQDKLNSESAARITEWGKEL